MGYKKNFKKRPKDDSIGLSVKVWNNNIEGALKVLKRKVKDSNIFIELRKHEQYTRRSAIRREKKNLSILRNKYNNEKENEKSNN